MARLARTIVVVLATFFLIAAPSASASGVTVSDLDNGATAQTLASSLTGGGVAVSNVTYTGSNRAAGSFTGGTSSIGFDTGLVLSSGKVQTYGGATPDDPCSRGVEGPNNCNEDASATDGGENTTSFGTAGDTDLDALLTGQTTEDAAVLQFDFVPQQSTVHFSYVFSSEEYNDFANSDFNDVFAFFVNGTNCALVPNTTDPVSINNINNGNPLGDATAQMPHNAQYFRDNVRPTPGSIDSQMDGLTTVLTCTANVNAGVTNHMKLAIADVGDSAYDSAVFIAAGSLISGRLLTVNKSGTGTGGVTSSPAGIDCGATCTHSYSDGTMVTLTATADAGSTFTGWSGEGCSGTGQCQVTMDQARTVTAAFSANPPQTLTVSKAGTGTGGVTSSPAGIDCGATCSHGFAGGTVVTLTATESFDSVFAGWSGEGCSGTGTCVVTMSQARNVTATFNLRPIHMITVTKNGSGTGGVTSSPAGIDCGATCSHSYPDGRDIVLTATADAGSVFTGWSGGGCSGTGTCTVNLNGADVNVTATFTANRTLTVSKNGTGSGGVTSSPAGIDCGATCSAQYLDGTSVTLTATAAAGSTFTGWSGEGCSGTGTCVVSMSQARNVTATFTANRTLTVSKNGSGSGGVTSSPAGIDCGTTCSAQYLDGTSVTLTATAAAGSTFTGWSGEGCSGTGTCVVSMSQARNVTATFDTIPPPPPVNHTLTVTKGGSGSGSVTSSPAGIDCGATCSHSYADGTGVTLTATAAAGSTFTGWSGDCTGTGTCTLTMSADHNVTATFTTVPPVVVPPSVGDGLFCGTQHRGQCKGLPVKGIFDRPGNASWTFDAYNPTPGKGATAAKTSKLHLGQVKKTIKKAGTVTIVFKLHAGAKTNKLYRQVKKLKLHSLLITLRFTDKQGVTVVQTKTIKLKV